MRPDISSLFVFAVAGGIAFLTGCGSSDSSENEEVVTANFEGTYRAKNAGPIAAISFSEQNQYMLMGETCREQSCAELGTFRIDQANHVLSLTSAAGETKTFPLQILTTAGTAKTSSLAPLTTGEAEAGSGEEPGTLLGAPEELLPGTIKDAKIGDQDVSRMQAAAGGCTSGIPTGYSSAASIAAYWSRCPNGALS